MTEEQWRKLIKKINGEFRQPQYDAAKKIYNTFNKSSKLILEAPTGTGKTIMYLGVAALTKKKLLVSTSGKLLQQQLCNSWKQLNSTDNATVIKGRSNYLCANVCSVYYASMKKTDIWHKELGMLKDYLNNNLDREIAIVSKALNWSKEFSDFVSAHLSSSSSLCCKKECRQDAGLDKDCDYDQLLQKANSSQLVITNHHALFTLACCNDSTDKLFFDRELVVDEAHDFVDAVSSVMTIKIDSNRLHALHTLVESSAKQYPKTIFDKVKKTVSKLISNTKNSMALLNSNNILTYKLSDKDNVCEKLRPLLKKMRVFDKELRESIPVQNRGNKLLSLQIQEVSDRISEIYNDLNYLLYPGGDQKNIEEYTNILDVVQDTDDWDEPPISKIRWLYRFYQEPSFWEDGMNGYVYYLRFHDDSSERWELARSLIDCNDLLKTLWSIFHSSTFLSATLTLPGKSIKQKFDWFCKQNGLDVNEKKEIIPPVFDLKKQCRIFIADPKSDFKQTMKENPEIFLFSRISLAGELIIAFQGRSLILFTATSRLRVAAEVLNEVVEELPACKLLWQGNGMSTQDLANEFITNSSSTLLATRSFFQGFDAPGETLSCLMLEKLPFEQKDDPILEAKKQQAGEEWFDDIYLPSMLMKLRQAFGRLIRSEKDKGIFVLSDPRPFQESCKYRNAVLEAIGISKESNVIKFKSTNDIFKVINKAFFSFELLPESSFNETLIKHWKLFSNTPLFRRLTGIVTKDEILKHFGIPKLYGWQEEIINNVMNGVPQQLVIYPAGSGKSLTYQLPAFLLPGLTLVISPLISLMYDQVSALKAKGLTRCAFLNSSLTEDEKGRIIGGLISGEIKLLYVAPERFMGDFINILLNVPNGISLFVVDEAHMISEAGSNFRPIYRELPKLRELLGKPKALLVTATAGRQIREDICKLFEIETKNIFATSVVRPQVRIGINPIRRISEHYDESVDFVRLAQGKPVLIYCSKIKYVESICTRLRENLQETIVSYHGELDACDRIKNHESFLNNNASVMVATSAYGMGIDKPDIWGVLFNNVPASLEEFVQGIGRICRDRKLINEYSGKDVGQPATAGVNYRQEDIVDLQKWKINEPFNNTIEQGKQIIRSLIGNNRFLRPDDLEDDFKIHYIALQYLRKEKYISSFCWDWQTLTFEIIRKNDPIGNQAIISFENHQHEFMLQKLIGLQSVKNFCEALTCRNKFLQIYFDEDTTPKICHYCDADECEDQNLEKHLNYIEKISNAFETERRNLYDNHGVFIGTDEEFFKEFDSCIDNASNINAQMGRLNKLHGETSLEASDYLILYRLLEFYQNYGKKKVIPFKVINQLLDDILHLNQTAAKMQGKQNIEHSKHLLEVFAEKKLSNKMKSIFMAPQLDKLKEMHTMLLDMNVSNRFSHQTDADNLVIFQSNVLNNLKSFITLFGDGDSEFNKRCDIFKTFICTAPQDNLTEEKLINVIQCKYLPKNPNGWIEWTETIYWLNRYLGNTPVLNNSVIDKNWNNLKSLLEKMLSIAGNLEGLFTPDLFCKLYGNNTELKAILVNREIVFKCLQNIRKLTRKGIWVDYALAA